MRGGKLWKVAVLLAPLAAILGMLLSNRYSTAASLGLSISSRDVTRIARAHAAAKGIDAKNWDALVDLKPANDLRHYLGTSATAAERAIVQRIVLPIPFRGVLEHPTRAADSVHVTVSPDGRLLSYRVPPSPRSAKTKATEADALRAAETELQRRLGADRAGFTRTAAGAKRHEATSSEIRTFTFRRATSNELALEALVQTSGTEVIAFVVTPKISEQHTKRFPELSRAVQITRGSIIFLLVVVGLIYVIMRFVRRLREQEVPLKRAAIVAALVFIAFAFSTLAGGETQRINTLEQGAAAPPVFNIILLILVSSVMAALVGVTWGACEADVREAYPEKLTSTDALLGGLLTSRAVRTSLVIGLTIGAYAILITALEPALRHAIGGWATVAEGELLAYQSAYPGLLVVLYAFTGAPVMMAVLLTAVSMTHRTGSGRKQQIALALLVLFFFLLGTAGNHTPLAWSAVAAIVYVAILLLPFLAGDVLAVIVSTAVSTWAGSSAMLIAQPAGIFRSAGWTMLALLLVLVALSIVAAFRKRASAVEEVARPEYARNIAERLMLKTEMDAARQAQLRVMPRIVPAVEGVRLAATYSTSAQIGTDYYEFFTAPGHVSVAVADTRMPGLSSALCVSMLKGLLLNYAARIDHPRDVADRVYRQLSTVFGDDLPVSFFFGRLDRATGMFLFATFGPAPHAVLLRDDSATSLEGEEFAELGADDAIVIYTAPLAEMQDRDGIAVGDEAIHTELASAPARDPRTLVDRLSEVAARQSRGVQSPQTWSAVGIAMEALS
ncbi:MAG TPA: SpoIIE family protein phosphatase [Thermoanaerobaculia bacterium]|nr:SpoIIE family protein phosphatase [Thermoanaerobaculia bacterium]